MKTINEALKTIPKNVNSFSTKKHSEKAKNTIKPKQEEEYDEDNMPTLEEMRAAWSIAPKNVRDYFAS